MITVFFGTAEGSFMERVATFEDENLFMKCLPALELEAKDCGLVVTESLEEES